MPQACLAGRNFAQGATNDSYALGLITEPVLLPAGRK